MRTLIPILLCVSFLGSCRIRGTSQADLDSFNSSVEPNEAAVVKIVNKQPGQNGKEQIAGECTLTGYHASYGITAAHCVPTDANTTIVAVFPDGRTVRSETFVKNRDFHAQSGGDLRGDLALVKFEEPAFSFTESLAPAAPTPRSEQVKIVGFGMRGLMESSLVSVVLAPQLSDEHQKSLGRLGDRWRRDLLELRGGYQAYKNKQLTEQDSRYALVQRFRAHVNRVRGSFFEGDPSEDNTSYIKRSGVTKLTYVADDLTVNESGQVTGAVVGDALLYFKGKFKESVLKDELDRKLFYMLSLYAPEESTETASVEDGLSASFGDSGGPLFDSDGHLAGVASHIKPELGNMIIYSAYVNLNSKKSLDFFRRAKEAGWVVPQSASASSGADNSPDSGQADGNEDPSDSDQPQEESAPSVTINQDLFAALASRPDEEGKYHLLISAGQPQAEIWVCQSDKLENCANPQSSTSTVIRTVTSSGGPSGRHNVRTATPFVITNGAASGAFSILTKDQAGQVSGVVVGATKRQG